MNNESTDERNFNGIVAIWSAETRTRLITSQQHAAVDAVLLL